MAKKGTAKQIFLSYGGPDKPFVRKLAADLKKVGIVVWFDEWEIKVGDSITEAVNQAIEKSAFFGAVISDNSLNRPWVQKELKTAMYYQVDGKLKILPVMLTNVMDIPPFIRELRYADFSGSYRVGLRDIVLAIDPSKATEIAILQDDITFSDKFAWFENDFNLDYLKTHSNQEKRQYSSNSESNQRLHDEILQEVKSEASHLSKSDEYSRIGVGSSKSGVTYLRDHLLWQAITPFGTVYDPHRLPSGPDPKYDLYIKIKNMLINGDSQFEELLFSNIKKLCLDKIKGEPAFAFANEGFKLFILDKIIAYFERFCLFEQIS